MNISFYNTVQKIDRLGVVQAKMADLKAESDALKSALVAEIPAGDRMEGQLFGASHSHTERSTTAWKSIATKLKASRQIIVANTKHTPVDTIKVTARKIA